jgi:hypothetical protein
MQGLFGVELVGFRVDGYTLEGHYFSGSVSLRQPLYFNIIHLCVCSHRSCCGACGSGCGGRAPAAIRRSSAADCVTLEI